MVGDPVKMLINRVYRIPLKLNNVQKSIFHQHAGCARFAYNWGLALIKEKLNNKELVPSAYELSRILNSIKANRFPWMLQLSKCAPQKALENLGGAIKDFFKKKSRFPRFKKKGRSVPSFKLIGSFKVTDSAIRLPKIGWVRFLRKGYLPVNSKVNSVTCKFYQDRWWTTVQVVEEITVEPPQNNEMVGVDVGLKWLATTSDGEVFSNERFTKKFEDKLKRANRSFSRKKKGSKNRAKARARLRRVHAKISNSRSNAIHQMTASLVKTKPSKIVIEDLNVAGMLKNRFLSKAVSDAAFGEIRRQLKYKCAWNGIELIEADRFFPSSKTCSVCGYRKKTLKLGTRTFRCEGCGAVLDRDLNAALNLKQSGTASSAGSSRGNAGEACGEGSSGRSGDTLVKLSSMKQEPDRELTINFY